MKRHKRLGLSRRRFMTLGSGLVTAGVLAACGDPTATTAPVTTTTAATTSTAASTTIAATTATTAISTAATATTTAAVTTTAPTTTTTVATTAAQVLAPTPSCVSPGAATQTQTEGPYYKPSSPLRTSLLEAGYNGPKMVLTGYVLGTNCQPIKGAWLDFWQADNNGQYDNSGFKMRGYQLTDDSGKFTLETAVPGLYPGRTRHIHVKVRAPNQPILTTQLYFPGEARNQNDGIYRKELEMQTKEANGVLQATFNFVLKIN